MKQWKTNDEYATSLNTEIMHDEKEYKQLQQVLTNVRQTFKRKKNGVKKANKSISWEKQKYKVSCHV